MLSLHAAFKTSDTRASLRHLLLGATILGLGASDLAAASQTPKIELHALDKSTVIKGELLEISDGSYLVKTALGTFRIGLDEAECIGDGCQRVEQFDADFAIYSESIDLNASMLNLLSGYANNLSDTYQINVTGNPANEFSIIDGNTDDHLASVALRVLDADGQAGLGDVSIVTEEPRQASGEDQDELLLALDGVAVVVHPDSPIAKLSPEAIGNIFACSKAAQKFLPASYRLTNIYAPSISSKTYEIFRTLILAPNNTDLCGQARQLPTDSDVANAVANDRNAIGLVSLNHVHKVKSLSVAACGVAHEPTAFSVKSGDYPLSRRIFLKAPSLEKSSGAVQRFIDFAISDSGQKLLEDAGLTGLNLDTTRSYATLYRLARIEAAAGSFQNVGVIEDFVRYTQNAIRVSSTFRFTTGSSNVGEASGLDNRAQRDLSRLANFMKTSAARDTEVLVFGFADSAGEYDLNLALSQQRAQSVADQLASLGVTVSVVAGLGEEAPIACNDNAADRAKNRRVEIWLRS